MQDIEAQRRRIEALFTKADSLSQDPELLSHWAKYLCVLVCGFLENSVELCLVAYCKKRGDENINNFVSTQMRSFQNPKMGKIVELFGSFSKTWEAELKAETDGRILDAVKKAMGDRVTTIFPRQGHYALDPETVAQYPPADLSVGPIADLLNWSYEP